MSKIEDRLSNRQPTMADRNLAVQARMLQDDQLDAVAGGFVSGGQGVIRLRHEHIRPE